MPVRSEANPFQDRRRPLRRLRRTPPVENLGDGRAEQVKDPQARQPVIGKEMGHVMSNGEALLFDLVGPTNKDEPMPTVRVQAPHEVSSVGRKARAAMMLP